jgi:Delta7-sterol 5-desaturase
LGYFAAASSLYWVLYLRRSSRFALALVTNADSTTKPFFTNLPSIWASIRSDVTLSVWSSGIFAICAAIMTSAYKMGYTRLYLSPQQYGLAYIGFSLVLVLLLQDTYFYFTHRLSHHPKCYQWLHQGHHHSKNPTPWTAFAFDPAEAMIQSIYLMGVTVFMPLHLSVLIAVVMIMTMGALLHHFGVRLFPDSAIGKWLGSWMIGPTHHWLHHRKYTVHYSLYFTFWDRLLGTQYEGYETVLSSPREQISLSTQVAKETVLTNKKDKTVSLPAPFKKAS